jgi:DNA mismatch repair protein MLH1
MCSLFGILKAFFYQRFLNCFANFAQFRLDPPVNITECISLVASDSDVIETAIVDHASLLWDYFSMSIEKSVLYSMPHVLEGYRPSFSAMPLFLRNIGSRVDWEDERSCYEGILDELSSLYAVNLDDQRDANLVKRLHHEIMTVLLPEMKTEAFKPAEDLLSEQSIIPIQI